VNLTAAYREVLEMLRSYEAQHELTKTQRKAVQLFEGKANKLQRALERRRQAGNCPGCQQRRASGIVCWHCWQQVPAEVRQQWDKAETGPERRAALRAIFEACRTTAIQKP
jgi:hypothetical protein